MGREHLRAAARKEAAALVRMIAELLPPKKETVRARIARAARRLGWSYRRTEDIWRGEAHRIEAWEMDQLRNWQPDD